MVTGTVNLSLADVDKLRQDVKEAQTALKAKEEELAQVKADRRTVLIEKTRPLSDSDLNIYLPEWKMSALMEDLKNQHRNSYTSEHEYFRGAHYGRNRSGFLINRYVDIHGREERTSEKTSYINFDDVQVEIRKQIESDVQDEMAKLKAETKNYAEKIANVREDYQQKNIALQKEYLAEKEKLKEELVAWAKKYKDLEDGKKEQTRIEELLEQVKNLNEQLEKEKAKKWYQKF